MGSNMENTTAKNNPTDLPKYIKAFGISYAGTLPKIRKSDNPLQPVFEAVTNALEAIQMSSNKGKGEILIKINLVKSAFSSEEKYFDFDSIQVEDNGVGFNEQEFDRLENLNDTRKGFLNKGSGRVQYLHTFEKTELTSTFEDSSSTTGYKERIFTLSKGDAFLKQNAIIHYQSLKEISASGSKTVVTFKTPLIKKDLDYYRELHVEELKANIIDRYLATFCENRDHLPQIKLQRNVNQQTVEEEKIESNDIPLIDQAKDITIHYSKVSGDGRTIEKTDKSETLNLKAFKIAKEKLPRNGLNLISKGEVAAPIKLEGLLPDDHIDGMRYLFLISGKYIDERDGDTRGKLNIPNQEDFKKAFGETLFPEEEILLDDIQDTANNTIVGLYEEIKNKGKEKELEIEKLKAMFLLNPESIRDAKIKLSDTEERILEKVYQADAKLIAKKDAEIKKRIDALDNLNPNSKEFRETLNREIEDLARALPTQNKIALTHYVARRKLVLQLFKKVLGRKLTVQQGEDRSADEKLLHNILFPQKSNDPEQSDLWILNEDFIYFSGTSDVPLSQVKLGGNKIFKMEFADEEEKYLKAGRQNRKIKRPDVLLFPAEGKCILIEFKDPAVNVAEHLSQTDFYAYLIRNYTVDTVQITTFYSYLIGENIEAKDVRGHVSAYEHSYHFDYLFRPSVKVIGESPRIDGSIYSEVIKFSTLIERAEKRNEIFIKKLTQ